VRWIASSKILRNRLPVFLPDKNRQEKRMVTIDDHPFLSIMKRDRELELRARVPVNVHDRAVDLHAHFLDE
jgi:hypothetical protein